ncbi:uncharacterized protein LOC107306747 isoform X1 [Coturnix japonica]|uniref:uncharacterized protein LOC107306747 isoform X1 n=1 Tax=Coturnix japonica TaxID=93934 RepID=UPI0013A5D237|nr:uncharacterized protein LOC107306747 isoform X1 [Coturnix japonica]
MKHKQESENLGLNRYEENLWAAFPSSTKKESPKWKEEQEKEDTRRKLQTTVLGDVKHSVSSNKHQVRKVSEDTAYARKAQPTVGAEKKEESDSPWDSEPCSEGPRKASPPVFLPPAVEHGVRLQSVSGEHNKGALPAVGTEKKEESDSPWDSEPCSEGSRKASPPVFLPPAVEHGVRLQSVSGEHNKGALPAVGTEKKEESDSPWDSEVLSVICASPRSVGEPDENYVRACLCVEPPAPGEAYLPHVAAARCPVSEGH